MLPYLLVPARKRGVKQGRISRKIAGDQFLLMQVTNLKKLCIQKIYLLSSYNDAPATSRIHISIFYLNIQISVDVNFKLLYLANLYSSYQISVTLVQLY